jgi:hypothetical protein
MSTQLSNAELLNLIRQEYFARNEPNASWVHYQSAILSTCAVKGFWPMSILHFATPNIYMHDVAVDHDLALTGDGTFPQVGYLASATQTSLPPWCDFTAANLEYLTYGMDDSQHDITGLETYVSTNERGLTLGGWFKFTSVPASNMGLMSKWYATAVNQRAYHLTKDAANNIVFAVSSDGAVGTVVTVTSTGTVAADQWYHIYGRLDPGTSLDVFIDNVKTSAAAGVPASIFDSNEPFHIARYNRVSYLNGKASMCHLNAAQLSDSIIEALWEQSRVMYGK